MIDGVLLGAMVFGGGIAVGLLDAIDGDGDEVSAEELGYE